MSRWKVVAVTLAGLAIIVLGIGYACLAAEGLSARRKPSNLEYAIANRALSVSIPLDAKARRNPIQSTSEILADAKRDYKEHCGVCHAEDGGGKTETAAGMSPEVPDLRAGHIQSLTDGELFYIVKNGVRFTGMPAWDMSDDHLWRLVTFIRELPKQYPAR